MSNVLIDSETLYSITLTGLTREDMVGILKNRGNQKQTIKEINVKIQQLLSMQPPAIPSHTVARPPISTKVECGRCHLMFEHNGLAVHMFRKHGVRMLPGWQRLGSRNVKMLGSGASGEEGGNTAKGLECPICHRDTSHSYGSTNGPIPFTESGLYKHIIHAHKEVSKDDARLLVTQAASRQTTQAVHNGVQVTAQQ